jgi:spermidine synthase
LGGGGFHRLFNAAFTNALLQTAEIDPLALKLATAHMGFKTTPRNVVTIEDGRRFVRKNRQKWDWVILDAFHGGDVPFHLKTREFYREIGRILATNGVMIANLHGNNELFYCDVKTILSSFSQALFLRAAGRGNVIAVAAEYRTPLLLEQLRTADRSQWPPVLWGYIDFDEIATSVVDVQPQGDVRGRLLTDDFAPAEYYNVRKE